MAAGLSVRVGALVARPLGRRRQSVEHRPEGDGQRVDVGPGRHLAPCLSLGEEHLADGGDLLAAAAEHLAHGRFLFRLGPGVDEDRRIGGHAGRAVERVE